ncbi:MAG: preprotein translocase subunit SecD [Methanimicrococcus sp.]|nr:preprotein translocase subunit SecD [Methanimicrococcus sp.]
MIEEKKDKPLYKDYKVILLIAALLISVFAIVSPVGYFAEEDSLLNVHYGLDIRGGSTIYLKLNGAVAQVDAQPRDIVSTMGNAEFPSGIEIVSSMVYDNGSAFVTFRTADPVNQTRLEYLFGTNDVHVRRTGNVSEVNISATKVGFITSYLTQAYGKEIVPHFVRHGIEYEIRTATTEEELSRHMRAVNGSISRDASGTPLYRDGTTAQTMQTTIDVLNSKLGNGLGVKDLPIRAIGNEFIMIDFAGVSLSEARGLVETPGRFEIRIQTSGTETVHVLYGDSIESVGVVSQDQSTWSYGVPFTLNEEGARSLQQMAISTGATMNPNAHNLLMLLDDVVVYAAPLSPSAASQLNSMPIYSWQAGTSSREEARELQIHLRSGALPVNVEIVSAGQVDANLGQGFLRGAIITGIFAMFAVALLIYNRYRQPKIVIPMVATSFSEVIILVGFSVLIMQDLDLAAIAGIIAVIGTGIDHLIIITEETIHEGKTPSDKVYLARMGKAFMIILGAAATTIIAMAPLVFLGFAALKGFAITTIVGVFIGVLIARPAYSSILRYILIQSGMKDDKLTE